MKNVYKKIYKSKSEFLAPSYRRQLINHYLFISTRVRFRENTRPRDQNKNALWIGSRNVTYVGWARPQRILIIVVV